MVQTILRAEQVIKACGLPRSTLYRKIAEGNFPRPVQLSTRAVGWLESDIADWQKARIAARDGEAA